MRAISRRSFAAYGAAACTLAGSARAIDPEDRIDLPSDAEIRRILADRIEALSSGRGGIGIVAGIIGPRGQRLVSVGRRDKGDARPITGDTLFEFGSVAKVFTALLLADMVARRQLSLTDPVARYLPASVVLPERNGRAITLVDLATHMSGLPFMPDLRPAGPYTDADLYEFLAHYRLTRDVGGGWDYSNLGYWLLSNALAARAGKPFETLLHERVIVPLGLRRTGLLPSSGLNGDMATGHDASLGRAPSLQNTPVYNLLPAAGVGFCSTANDALKFLSFAMGLRRSELAPAFALTVNTRRPIPGSTDVQALGWTLLPDGLVFRDGGTLGFASCIVWDQESRLGAVVLANCVADVSDIARHILRPAFPLRKPTSSIHTEIALDAGVLAGYAGRYEAQGEGVFTIALASGYLTIEAPADWGLPKLRLHPESPHDFFASELPLRATFHTASDGSTVSMTIYPPRGQNGVEASKIG